MTECSPAKTGESPRIFPNFQNCVCCEKDLKDNKHNSLHLAQKYARIFVLRQICFLHSRKTVSSSEQIMSADKYPNIFSCQMETIAYSNKFSNNLNCLLVLFYFYHL